ncbi:MAG: bifunctional 2-keto-4-hydroxyglutarate aldolase/2-keto-3-deoxy-6-phosphogluconate aldolase [Acholeplasmatales bacterium]|jgi:2-dehydro-3-deoxyphosphogluconate aldolase/(4S)-4-hydroxy-2-oxoglutarate aldolase|nr:bifunctional 2-keto-4-hydroxyglutarate aldolase/2-keto-3-deoxy-6-phosphogluconate aldolase [Acholeplasmatales bacterium]
MSKKNKPISTKKSNNPYLVDKLAKIPPWFKSLFLKFWVSGAIFFLIFMSAEIARLDTLDLLAAYVLLLTLGNEYIVNNLIRYMNIDESPTLKYLPHFVRKKSLWSLMATLLYTIIMVALVYISLWLWVEVLDLHTIDHYLLAQPIEGSSVEAGPIGFAITYFCIDQVYLFIRNPILKRYMKTPKFINKQTLFKYIEESKMDALNYIKEKKLVAVVRANSKEEAIRVAKAIYDGGARVLEMTFTIPEASSTIASLINSFKDEENRPIIGAGTVITAKEAISAIHAGAAFIVAPGYSKKVAKVCKKNNVEYIPGVITPTEIITALDGGAHMVKLFPGSLTTSSYVKAIKGPFPNLEIMVTGGVSIDNAQEWLAAGVVALGIGSELTKPASKGDYEGTTKLTKNFLEKIK